MKRAAVIDVVGLTPRLLEGGAPNLARLARGGWCARLRETLPAVTCTSQASMLTGALPRRHGIVANGWYFREPAEVAFWKQSHALVGAEEVCDDLRRRHPGFTWAKLFWWFNMYSGADWSITPRPHYGADGSKVFDVYTDPIGMGDEVVRALGPFPFRAFWGPGSSIESSRWIARSARWVEERHRPTLSLVYLPHLDYPLQRLGPGDPAIRAEVGAIDAVVGDLLEFYEGRGVRVLVVSEYGITPVRRHLHPNRLLREAGLLRVRPSLGRELLDPGASEAFAVADHQICHVYVKDPARVEGVARLLEGIPGTRSVLRGEGLVEAGLDHPRSGELVLVAESDCWYTYYYWLDDDRAPDFARTVDIHRKPGYDPLELFLDPDLPFPRLKIAWTLLRKSLGFRYRMEVIPLRPELVRGSHGAPVADPQDGPLALSRLESARPDSGTLPITAVRDLIARHVEDAG